MPSSLSRGLYSRLNSKELSHVKEPLSYRLLRSTISYIARLAGLNPPAVGYRSMDLAVTDHPIGGSTPRPPIMKCWRAV